MVCVFGALSEERAQSSVFGPTPEYSPHFLGCGWWRDAKKLVRVLCLQGFITILSFKKLAESQSLIPTKQLRNS